jgi:hypothetical protein
MEPTPRPLAPRVVAGKPASNHNRGILGRAPNFTLLVQRFSIEIYADGNTCTIGPKLRRFAHVPGVNGVRAAKSADGVRVGDPKAALQNLNKDAVVLPHADQPGGRTWSAFGHDGLDYVVAYENGRGGRHYVPFWCRPIPGLRAVETDYKARNEFLAWARTFAGEPYQAEIDGLKTALEYQVIGLEEGARRNPAKASKLRAIRRQLTAFDKTVAAPGLPVSASATVSPETQALAELLKQQAAIIEQLQAQLNSKPSPPAEPVPGPTADDENEDESEDLDFDLPDPQAMQ